MQIRDRIKELRRVPASELLPNPKNWRTHPVAQQDALRGVLAEVGYADALLARETPEGLMLVDGHLRAETTPDADVPVLVLDIDEAEADLMLATLDPLAAMAGRDVDALADLVGSLDVENESIRQLLRSLNDLDYGLPVPLGDPPVEGEDTRSGYYLLVYSTPSEAKAWLDMLGVDEDFAKGRTNFHIGDVAFNGVG